MTAALLAEARALVDAPDAPSGPGLPPWVARVAAAGGGLAPFVDHTLLKAEARRDDVRALAAEGRRLGVAAVCVNGMWVPVVREVLQGSAVRTAAVVGFPLGAMASGAKADETRRAVADGADEIDMVVPLGAIKGGEWALVEDDIRAVVAAAGTAGVKVILESAALTAVEIAAASLLSARAGARFVKTSTGFHAAGGASEDAVRLMRRAVGPDLGVKASGGVRTVAQAVAMLLAGADRLGTSSASSWTSALGPGAPPLSAVAGASAPASTPERGGY